MSEIAVKPRVTMIPATLNRFTAVPIHTAKKRRVAAYARVSTDDEEQQTSYENQISYYTEYIRNHDGWEYAGIFTDEERSYPALFRPDRTLFSFTVWLALTLLTQLPNGSLCLVNKYRILIYFRFPEQ